MLDGLINFIRDLFAPKPVHLAIVRKYQDANGNYVGELYLEQTIKRKHDELKGYTMIGASLDSLALNFDGASMVWGLDTRNDFLAPMSKGIVRVGAFDPKDNDDVRRTIARMPRYKMALTVQNRFIERVLDEKHS